MKCSCYCTASNYRIKHLFEFLSKHYESVKLYRDAIHVQIQESNIFYFSYGCVIFWNTEGKVEHKLLTQIKEFEQESLTEPTFELFNYQLGVVTSISTEKDLIILESEDPLILLAFSFALAQSIKLITFEESVDKTIKNTGYIPKDLSEKGKISLSRKAISQNMGNLFIARSSINLKTDFLGEPEFFWENPAFESYYIKAATYLEIQKRVDVLNKRLDVIRELFEMLGDELRHQHSSILELIIIWLIAIEIAIVLIQQIKW